MSEMKVKEDRVVNFGAIEIPFSSDPMDYDYYIHHLAFSSIFGKLISAESSQGYVPILAEKWSNFENFTKWQFKIRENLKFSNGDDLKIEDIVLNFKRIIFLKRLKKSRSGLFEFIEGFDNHTLLINDIDGIRVDGNILEFRFTKPMPKLLELISFGFYGIAHPSLYNHETGEWLDQKKVISSGAYEVTEWNEDSYRIKLRKNLPFVNYDKRLTSINFWVTYKIKKSSDLDHIDFLISDKLSLLVDERFEFIGSSLNLKIGYMKCNSWDKANSPFRDVAVRKWFRQRFYEGLRKIDFKTTNSFFPPLLNGIKKIENDEKIEKPLFANFVLKTHGMPVSLKIEENSNKLGMAEIFSKGLENLGGDSGAILIQDDYLENNQYDVFITSTGVEFSDYLETVRFMFLSKEGIKLPDSTGIILKELKKDNPDINIINQEIWDQAIVWPIRHYTTGYWFNRDSKIDYIEMNFDSPSIDFQFLKWK